MPTKLQAIESAHICARAAWLFPSDPSQREAAIVACQNINLDYIESVANVMESTRCQPEAARREIAESLRRTAERYYHDDPEAARPD